MLQLNNSNNTKSLEGKLLIANPFKHTDNIFEKAVVFIISHSSEDGAVGIMVNHHVNQLPFNTIFKAIKQGEEVEFNDSKISVYLGGPVEPERGFVLHDGTNKDNNSEFTAGEDNINVSSNLQIIKDIARGNGPKHSLFVMGYAGWEAGQLENEIASDDWFVGECDSNLIFMQEDSKKWNFALEQLGINFSNMSSLYGQC